MKVYDLKIVGYPGYLLDTNLNVYSTKSTKWLTHDRTGRCNLTSEEGCKIKISPRKLLAEIVNEVFHDNTSSNDSGVELPTYPGYRIYRNGIVWSDRRIKQLSPNIVKGYHYVKVYDVVLEKYRSVLLHRLVAQAYLPNPDNLPEVNHKDGNKLNNNVDNLEWTCRSGNMKHAYLTGLVDIHKAVALSRISKRKHIEEIPIPDKDNPKLDTIIDILHLGKTFKGYEGVIVFPDGRVFGRWKKLFYKYHIYNGRSYVNLPSSVDKKQHSFPIATLVAELFVDKPINSFECNVEFKDGDHTNFNSSNLYWV